MRALNPPSENQPILMSVVGSGCKDLGMNFFHQQSSRPDPLIITTVFELLPTCVPVPLVMLRAVIPPRMVNVVFMLMCLFNKNKEDRKSPVFPMSIILFILFISLRFHTSIKKV